MNELFWYLFEKSGDINYYLAYKQRDILGAEANEFRENTRDNNS